MHIAEVATLATPVGPEGSGSVEGLVWSLARGLGRRGHQVTVFASVGSSVPPGASLVTRLPGTYGTDGSPDDWQLCEVINVSGALEQSATFDVVHSHNYLWGVPLGPLSAAPMVHTLHVLPYGDAARLLALYPRTWLTAVSGFQWSAFPDVRPAAVIHHGVDPDRFTFRPEAEDYVCYLGRFLPSKGAVAAVAAARALGVPIRLGGPRDQFFDEMVAPLVDGESVVYVGAVSAAGRDELLGGARALLYPLEWGEPFGLVMPEAMMCGTPVAATTIGAVPEIVDEGVTGSLAEAGKAFTSAVERAMQLDRGAVRARALERFHIDRMVDDYERVLGRASTSA